MFWAQVVLPFIVGLIAWQNVQAEESFVVKVQPGNKTVFAAPPLADNFLYTHFACRNKQNGLRLPLAGSCVDYYECQQGVAKRLTCKPGMHFSNLGLTCLDARLSDCKAEQLTIQCEGMCCGLEDGLYPVQDSCSDYVICVNGQTFQRSCGRMLHFSTENRICDIPQRARCTAIIDKDIIDKPVEEQDTDLLPPRVTMYWVSHRVCQNYPNGYYAPISGSCNKFYLCIRGVGYLKSCGKMQFNPEGHYCDSRNRMFCPENDEGEIILDVEYAEVDVLPMPIPRPRPRPQGSLIKPLKPIPLDLDEEDEKPIESEEEIDENEIPPRKRPQKGKKPIPQEEEIVNQRPHGGKKPRPPVVEEEEEEELVQSLPHWGKKPAQRPENPEELEADQQLRPNKQPANEKPQQQGGSKQSRPRPPHFKPVPPQIDSPEVELEEVVESVLEDSNICSDQPVGALMAMPGDCSKYIRCRWDWYQRRIAEVLTCPFGMNYNAKTKYCDTPENAGCLVKSKKENQVIKKKNKLANIF